MSKDIYIITENDYQTLNDMCFEFGIIDICSTEQQAKSRLLEHVTKCNAENDLDIEYWNNNLGVTMKDLNADCEFYSCEATIDTYKINSDVFKPVVVIETNSRPLAIESCCGEVLGVFNTQDEAIDYVVMTHLEKIKGYGISEFISNEIIDMNKEQIREYLKDSQHLLFEENGDEDSDNYFQILIKEIEVA